MYTFLIINFKAMNRSLTSVILGGFGNKTVKSSEQTTAICGTHTEANVDQVADLMINAKNIIITPGMVELKLFLVNFTYLLILFFPEYLS